MKITYFLFSLILLGTFLHVNGQNQRPSAWLNVISPSNSTLTQSETQKISQIISKGIYSDYWVVNSQPLGNFIQNDKLLMNLPGRIFPEKFSKKWVGGSGSGQLVWEGKTISGDGYATILTDNNKMFGHIRSGDEDFMLYSMEESNTSVIFKKTKVPLPDTVKTCGTRSGSSADGSLPQVDLPNGNRLGAWQNADIRVLIYYTPMAENEDPNVTQTALTAIAETNSAYRNSGLTINHVNLISVGVLELDVLPNGWTEAPNGADYEFDIEALIADPLVQARRNLERADIVVCLTGDVYGGTRGVAGGDEENFDLLDPERAYAIVEVPHAVSEFVFAHEVGHLFDCWHHDEDGNVSYSRGHTFWKWFKKYRTIMAYFGSNNGIPHFSNPDVDYLNKATGSGSRDNARRIEERALIVADYRTGGSPSLSASIQGPSTGFAEDYAFFQSDVTGGEPGLYSYEWRTSTSGSPTGPILSTGFNFATTLPNNPYSNLYVHLKVTSADDQVRNAVKTVFILDPNQNWRSSPELNELEVYPNPAKDKLVLSLEAIEKGHATIFIYNSLGKLVKKEDFYHISGSVKYKFNLSGLATGVYMVMIQTGKQQAWRKFIKEN